MTHAEWYNYIYGKLADFSELGGLLPGANETARKLTEDFRLNPSRVSIERLLVSAMAFACVLLEQLFARHKVEAAQILAEGRPGTYGWVSAIARAFRWNAALGQGYAYDLDEGTQRLRYGQDALDDGAALVVAGAVAELHAGGDNVVMVKVAGGAPGAFVPLREEQVLALQRFLNDALFAGQAFSVVSAPGDDVRAAVRVFYNPLFGRDNVREAVRAAVAGYLASVAFGGKVSRTRMVDAIQAVEGVEDVEVDDLEARALGGLYTSAGREYVTRAGYAVLAGDSSFNMIAQL